MKGDLGRSCGPCFNLCCTDVLIAKEIEKKPKNLAHSVCAEPNHRR